MTPLFAFANFLNLVVAQSLRGTEHEWCAEGWTQAYEWNHHFPRWSDLDELQRAWESA